ncbi:hypothetical protein GCM10028818_59120 [Spirosoma horti]
MKSIAFSSIIDLFLVKENISENFISDINVLFNVDFLTKELFDELKHAGYLNKDADLNDLLFLYELNDGYYIKIPKMFQYFRNYNNDKINEITDVENLIKIISHSYSKELLKIDNAKYKDIYSELMRLSKGLPINIYGKFIFPSISNLLQKEEYDFLFPFLKEALDYLNSKENRDNDYAKIYKAIVLVCLAKIHVYKFENNSAISAIDTSINIFKDIVEENNEQINDDIYIEWYWQAYITKGEIYSEENKFFSSVSSFLEADNILLSSYTKRELARIYKYFSFFQHTENQLLIFKKIISDYDNKDIKFADNKVFLYELGLYYEELGFYDEALKVKESHLKKETKGDKDNLWYAAALRESGIAHFNVIINSNKKSEGKRFSKAREAILDSINIFTKLNNEKFNVKSYNCLAANELYNNNINKAYIYIKQSFDLICKYYQPNYKEFIEYYLLYADMLLKLNAIKECKTLLINVYDLANINLGSHHLIIRKIIEKMYQIDSIDNREILDNHYISIEKIRNSDIRLNEFDLNYIDSSSLILETVRRKYLAILPSNNEDIKVFAFSLPFYKTIQLVHIEYKALGMNMSRYFFYNNIDEIHLLDYSNQPLHNIPNNQLLLNDKQVAKIYIRFFFDCVEGKHGKFYILESSIKDIPWAYNVSDLDKEEDIEKLNNLVKPISFLFEENVFLEESEVLFFHFSVFMFFKDSLFQSKVELNTSNGLVRLYDEKVIEEKFHITVDLKSTII